MKWNIERSNEVKKQIAGNEELMQHLSETVAATLKEFGVDLKEMSYIFEPRVFSMDKNEMPEVQIRSHAAKITAIIDDWLERRGSLVEMVEEDKFPRPIPFPGLLDRLRLRDIEEYRLVEKYHIKDDPVPMITDDMLIKNIVGNKELLNTLSGKVFDVLARYDIKFGEEEGCLFTPVVFETPVYAQIVGKINDYGQIRGFGPAVFADPEPQPTMPGVIRVGDGLAVGVLIKDWWWIGIPAPEMLVGLDRIRENVRI